MKNKNLRIKIIQKFNSQAGFAMIAGISESRVSRVIAGRYKLPLEEQKQWAKLLDCSTNIFKG